MALLQNTVVLFKYSIEYCTIIAKLVLESCRADMKDSCSPKPNLENRELIAPDMAGQLEELFKVLGNDTRIRLLHVLIREKEAPVNEIADQLGMSAQAVSSHLQKLSLSGIVGARRDGTFIYYRVLDPCVPILLDRGLCLLEEREAKVFGIRQ